MEVRNEIDRRFNEDELKDLCFELRVDYEDLKGGRKTDKVRELVTQMDRIDRIDDLLENCKKKRPDGKWPAPPLAQMSSKRPSGIEW